MTVGAVTPFFLAIRIPDCAKPPSCPLMWIYSNVAFIKNILAIMSDN